MILKLECKRNLIIGILLLVNSLLLAHNPNEAFFTISINGNYTEIVAELPWSVRNDLILSYPELEDSKNDQDYKDAFQKYIQEKIIIRNKLGEILPFVNAKEEDHNGHSHQNNFRIIFEGTDFYHLENSILFGSYDNQKNYHFLTKDRKKHTFITSKKSPSFTVDGLPFVPTRNFKYWIVVTLMILPLMGYFLFKRKPSQ
ncbi:MAG: hypothetical protein ACJA01_004441 [Saprospiraceae bacterium]|jgi:hypothetical protein